jgi:hypothetical protein
MLLEEPLEHMTASARKNIITTLLLIFEYSIMYAKLNIN